MKIFEIENFRENMIGNCMKMKIFDFFRSQNLHFSYNFQWKSRNFAASKIFADRFSFWPNFLSNEPFLIRFFLNRSRFPRRTRWNRFPVDWEGFWRWKLLRKIFWPLANKLHWKETFKKNETICQLRYFFQQHCNHPHQRIYIFRSDIITSEPCL